MASNPCKVLRKSLQWAYMVGMSTYLVLTGPRYMSASQELLKDPGQRVARSIHAKAQTKLQGFELSPPQKLDVFMMFDVFSYQDVWTDGNCSQAHFKISISTF